MPVLLVIHIKYILLYVLINAYYYIINLWVLTYFDSNCPRNLQHFAFKSNVLRKGLGFPQDRQKGPQCKKKRGPETSSKGFRAINSGTPHSPLK